MTRRKYKMNRPDENLSDEQVNSFQNFDAILAKSIALKRKSVLGKKITITAAGILFFATCFFFLIKQNQQADIRNKKIVLQIDSTHASLRSANERPASAEKIDSSETLTNTVETKLHSKNPTVSSKTPKESILQNTPFREATPEGGYEQLYQFFKENLQYPEEAKKKGISGTVTIELFINEKGKAQELSVIQSADPLLNTEAIRLIHTMPAWKPALVNGKNVSTRQVIPITFYLQPKK